MTFPLSLLGFFRYVTASDNLETYVRKLVFLDILEIMQRFPNFLERLLDCLVLQHPMGSPLIPSAIYLVFD